MDFKSEIIVPQQPEPQSPPDGQRSLLETRERIIFAKTLKNAATAKTAEAAVHRISIAIDQIDAKLARMGQTPSARLLESLKQDYLSFRDRAHSILQKAGAHSGEHDDADHDGHIDVGSLSHHDISEEAHHHDAAHGHGTELAHLNSDIRDVNQRYERAVQYGNPMSIRNPSVSYGGQSSKRVESRTSARAM